MLSHVWVSVRLFIERKTISSLPGKIYPRFSVGYTCVRLSDCAKAKNNLEPRTYIQRNTSRLYALWYYYYYYYTNFKRRTRTHAASWREQKRKTIKIQQITRKIYFRSRQTETTRKNKIIRNQRNSSGYQQPEASRDRSSTNRPTGQGTRMPFRWAYTKTFDSAQTYIGTSTLLADLNAPKIQNKK